MSTEKWMEEAAREIADSLRCDADTSGWWWAGREMPKLAAQVLARHFAAREREEWIPVSERLPDDHEDVLVRILDNEAPYFDVWTYDAQYPNQYWTSGPPNGVTHWRRIPPLPAAPFTAAQGEKSNHE